MAAAKNYLIEDGEKYEGNYVTTCSPESKRVVSFSKSPKDAYNRAKKAGCPEPVLIYVPTKDEQTFVF